MPWARIDDAFDDHPKVLALLEHENGVAAIGLWSLCLTWAYRNTLKRGKVPGLIPASLPRRYAGPAGKDLAALLAAAPAGFATGLWEPRAGGEWMIHDLSEYLPSDKTRAARAEAGRRGAESRWGKGAGSDGKLPRSDSKKMARDGKSARIGAESGPVGTDPSRSPKPDGNLSSRHGNLPSGLPSGDGKPIASDGSRAPAHRAISNEIAPVPVPIPPSAAQEAGGDTAQTLVAEWLDHCRKRPPDRVIGQVAKELVLLLAEGQDPADIRRGLAAWHLAAKHPSTLASFINEIMNGTSGTRKVPGPGALPGVSPRDEHRYRR